MQFEWQPIRARDPDGRLTAAGVRWCECRGVAEALCLSLAVLVCMAGVGGLVISMLDGSPTIAGALLLGFGIWLWRCSFRLPGRRRELVFGQDGSMNAPLGFAHYADSWREVLGHNADIVSIEMRKEGPGDIRVAMFMRGGAVVYAAGSLVQDQAHMVAVQLTLALAELREAVSDHRREAGHGPASARAGEFID